MEKWSNIARHECRPDIKISSFMDIRKKDYISPFSGITKFVYRTTLYLQNLRTGDIKFVMVIQNIDARPRSTGRSFAHRGHD